MEFSGMAAPGNQVEIVFSGNFKLRLTPVDAWGQKSYDMMTAKGAGSRLSGRKTR
jgi:hypothetical protein